MLPLSARALLLFFAATAATLLFSRASQAQFQIDWYTIDGGGGTSSGGPYTLSGTIGQADADVVSLCSADGGPGCVNPTYELTGGFWVGLGAGAPETCGSDLNCVFRDGFES